ncbi:MAG: hypothetical protein WEB33_03795 [Bacteroidota bacterium]
MNRFLSAGLVLSFVLIGCSSGPWGLSEKAYRSGDMVNAVRYAVETLREDPGHAEALDFLSRELPGIYDNTYAQAQRAEGANDWDLAYMLYEDILTMSDAVRSLPPQTHEDSGQMVTLRTRNVETEFQNARRQAAEKHYTAGISFEDKGMAKDAAKEYARALDYIVDYKESRQRYEKNRKAAVMRIAVMPFDNLSGKNWYGAIGVVVADRVISEAMQDPKNMEFLEFVTREKIDDLIRELKFEQTEFIDPASAARIGKLLGIHAFVFGKITSVVSDYPPDIVSMYRDEDEISQGKDKPKKKVTATVTAITRRATAKLNASYQIIDVERGTIVKSGNVPHLQIVEIKFGKYRGDKEALTHRSRQLCSIPEAYPPPDDELVHRAAEGASRELAMEIAGYFR